MINNNYKENAKLILEELFNSLSADDKKHLKALVKNLLVSGKIKELEDKLLQSEIRDYIKASKEERTQTERWQEHNYRLIITFFSFKYVYRGYKLINIFNSLPEDGHYGHVIAEYSIAPVAIIFNEDYLKIFDEELRLD